jgi:hypothetical protein
LPGWQILDFDQREAFEAVLAAGPADRTAALTYDDTTITRGRLSELVALMMIKPLCRELVDHPLLRQESEQL